MVATLHPADFDTTCHHCASEALHGEVCGRCGMCQRCGEFADDCQCLAPATQRFSVACNEFWREW